MKRKVLILIYIILILITLKLLCNVLINSILISNYNNGKYSDSQARVLTFLNFSESYIAHYNYGNILYQNGEYEEAIEEYEKALNGFIPKYKECNIRINYALAICKTVSVDEKDQTSIKNAIKKYESAIEVLTEEGCANKNDDRGHNQKAEQLKKDIQKEIDRLKKLQETENTETNDEEEDNPKEDEDNKDSKDNTEKVEEEIQEIKGNATQKQRETESQYEDFGNFDYDRVEKNW